MLYYWFSLPVVGIFAVLIAVYGTIAVVIHLVTFRSPLRSACASLAGIAAPMVGVFGLMFGLLTGFLAAEISARNSQAENAVSGETNALYEVRTLSVASASEMAGVRDTLREFVRSELRDEWPKMSQAGRSAATETAFGNLLREVADPKIARDSGAAVHVALLGAVSRVGVARSQRLAISNDTTNTVKWVTVLVLAMITQIAIGLVHVEKPRAQIATLTLFTSSLVVALGLIAMQEWPFIGPLQIRPTPLQEVLDLMSKLP
ncbi:MAG TPA: hypothetical protein VM867_02355 [Xanthobacteraceae bacterium]|nr:hypothetical protein [Xanthobacteraceae bacterium]